MDFLVVKGGTSIVSNRYVFPRVHKVDLYSDQPYLHIHVYKFDSASIDVCAALPLFLKAAYYCEPRFYD